MALISIHGIERLRIVLPRLSNVVNLSSLVIMIAAFFLPNVISLFILFPLLIGHSLIFRIHFKNKASFRTLIATALVVVLGSVQIISALLPHTGS